MTPETMALVHARAFTKSRSWIADEFHSLLASPLCFFVAEAHSFAIGRVIVDEAELLTIAVDPDWQGKGLGSQILARFEKAARSKGATMAFLEVADDNSAAIALYEQAGYTEQSRRPSYYARPDGARVDARIMQRNLTENA